MGHCVTAADDVQISGCQMKIENPVFEGLPFKWKRTEITVGEADKSEPLPVATLPWSLIKVTAKADCFWVCFGLAVYPHGKGIPGVQIAH